MTDRLSKPHSQQALLDFINTQSDEPSIIFNSKDIMSALSSNQTESQHDIFSQHTSNLALSIELLEQLIDASSDLESITNICQKVYPINELYPIIITR